MMSSFDSMEEEHYSRLQEEYERTPWNRKQPGYYEIRDIDNYIDPDSAFDYAWEELGLREAVEAYMFENGGLDDFYRDNGFVVVKEEY